ncbi:glycosyltransferase family 4 protein [Bradyrhizobium sp. LHD-71]|uniref:glycosyltransferase family 4 protein n=1 Tax=Bradyrhizobium sp. LHD-71 TaxID=3072141 RepID=UPI00280CFC7F|nr:glycosyltransferase family 4 protein [Bradyrhizobium sp. LHD-71]MDQ8726666.1 glycosyltransferase family 4 protein [Bradyrhizobium sp. LHD-71]
MTRPQRILLIQTQGENAGAQEIARILAEGFAARGYEVSNLFFFRKSSTFSEPVNTFYCAPERPSSPLQLMRMLLNLARHIRHLQPDVILTFQHYGNVIAAPVARLVSSAPVVANQVSALATMSKLLRAADFCLGAAGVFKVVTVNSIDVQRIYATYPKAYSDRVVHVAHGFAERTSQLTREAARSVFGLPRDAAILGCVARLHPLKGLDHAVRLLALRPDWHLALLGQGPDRQRLLDLATELGVADRLHFAGEVAPERTGDFLVALDAFVFPSAAETFGLAAVEAAQAGVPVVANKLPVLQEVLSADDAPMALFVDAADTKEFAAATSRVLTDRTLRATLRQNAQQLKSRYSIDAMVEDYERIFATLFHRRTLQFGLSQDDSRTPI